MMNKFMYGVGIASLALVAIPAVVQAQRVQDLQGWNNTRWGMSYDQIKRLYPSIGPLETLSSQSEFYSNATHVSIVENFQSEDYNYRIYFHFVGSQLESVTLYNNTELNSYSPILSSLTRKYGASYIIPGDTVTQRRWELPTTEVTFAWNEGCHSRNSIFTCRIFLVYKSQQY